MGEKSKSQPKYRLDTKNEHANTSSLSVLIAERKCYQHRPVENQHSVLGTRPEDHIREVREHCSTTPDYLLPDTPIKEAIFRLMIASGNKAVTPLQVSDDLSERWATSGQPRYISESVVQIIMDNSKNWFIHPVVDQKRR